MTTAALYSQPQTAQDAWIIEKTQGLCQGYFVEVGGYDGIRHSNTLALEENYEWYGLLVEPNPQLYPKLIENRPGCKHDNVAIGPSEGLHTFIVGDAFSGLTGYMPRQWYREHKRRGNQIISVETITLSHLFDKHLCPLVIDYLSLDVEGAEYAILEEYLANMSKHGQPVAIRYLTVEFRHDMELLADLKELLSPHFHFDKIQAWDAFFVSKEFA